MRIDEITSPQNVDLSGLHSLLAGPQSRDEIVNIVTDYIENTLDEDVDITVDTSDAVSRGMLAIGGAYYDPENDEDGDTAIEVILTFNPEDNSIDWDKEKAASFSHELADALKHELLHANQYRKRNFHKGNKGYDRRSKEYEYMSRPDEIEAYAMNIADELIRKVDKDGAIALLRMAKKTAQFRDKMDNLLSPNLFAFFTVFEWDMNHPVLKRLMKKIYQYITNV